MTDSEMWMEMHYGLKAVGDEALDSEGLCEMLDNYLASGAISSEQWKRMERRLNDTFDPTGLTGYYWPEGKAAPRIKACLKMAKLTEGKT